MTELKSCPFCGGEAYLQKGHDCIASAVRCKVCEGAIFGHRDEVAVERWNTRPSNWHPGTPTEEGWFLVCIKAEDGLHYDTDFNNGDCWVYGIVDTSKILAWQKIELYKEKQDGRTD